MTSIGVALGLKALFHDTDHPIIAKSVAEVFILVAVLIFWAALSKARKAQQRMSCHDVQAESLKRMFFFSNFVDVCRGYYRNYSLATIALLLSRWSLCWADCARKVGVTVAVLLVLVFYNSVSFAYSLGHQHHGLTIASQVATGSSLSPLKFSEACCGEASNRSFDTLISTDCALECGTNAEHCDHSSCDVACCMLMTALPSPYFALSHARVSSSSFLGITVGALVFEFLPSLPPPKV